MLSIAYVTLDSTTYKQSLPLLTSTMTSPLSLSLSEVKACTAMVPTPRLHQQCHSRPFYYCFIAAERDIICVHNCCPTAFGSKLLRSGFMYSTSFTLFLQGLALNEALFQCLCRWRFIFKMTLGLESRVHTYKWRCSHCQHWRSVLVWQVLELMKEVGEDEDSSDISGYHSDSDSAIMMSGNSPYVTKRARHNFLTRSGEQCFTTCICLSLCIFTSAKSIKYFVKSGTQGAVPSHPQY